MARNNSNCSQPAGSPDFMPWIAPSEKDTANDPRAATGRFDFYLANCKISSS
jgi:hypothetical protein